MGVNSTEVAYNFGQLGSVFTASTSTAITPPTDKVFVAVTMLADTTFDQTGGLVADNNIATGLEYAGTTTAAHDAALSPDLGESGTGGTVVDHNNTFPKGITIYGRWTEIELASGGPIIAYIGD